MGVVFFFLYDTYNESGERKHHHLVESLADYLRKYKREYSFERHYSGKYHREENEGIYGFPAKWHFALWSLERQMRRIDALRKLFNELYMPSAAPVARAPAEQENEEIDDEIIILD